MLHTGFPSPPPPISVSLLATPLTAPAPQSHTGPSDSLLSSVACLISVLVSPCLCPCPGLSPSVPVLVSPRLCPRLGLSPSLSWSLPTCPCLSLSWSLPVSVPVLVSPYLCPGLCLTLSLASGSRLSGRLGRSESLRVSDRRRPSRGSLGAKGRGGGRSRSDVDMDPSSATAVLGPARRATYVPPPPHPLRQPGESGRPGWGIFARITKSWVSDAEVTEGLQWSQERGKRLLSRSGGWSAALGDGVGHYKKLKALLWDALRWGPNEASVPQPRAWRRGGAGPIGTRAGTRRAPRLAGARPPGHPAQPSQEPGEAAGGHQR